MFPCPDLYLDLPCSWAFMQFDFDIRTGLMACADVFGRIAIVDYYSRDSRCIWALPRPEVGFEKEIELRQVVASTVPIPLAHASSLDLIMSESLKMPLSIRCDAVVTSNMGDWSVDWASWSACHLWQWFPGSLSWILRYYYGILVECVPIAYRASEVLFRASGFQYLFHLSFFPDAQDMVDWYPYNNVFHLRLCPADVVDDLSSFPDLSTLWEMDRSHKYVHARYIYETIYTLEVKSGRDRWLEQRGRGGVHPPGLPTLWDFHRFKFMPHLKTVTWSPVDIIDEVPSKPQTNVAVTSEWITPDRQCMCPPFPFIRQDPCPPKSQ
ncbi:hypothetical protein QCA50_010803 [Cerrena zonata]|uniref:Uncharacterized protein n=1 Tax=Cerrena zonata TaxID=2478898 RepID=A0AAW0G864_9APHY